MVNILYTEKFTAQFERLPKKIQDEAYKKIELFIQNPKHASLKSHKLHGPLSGRFAFSVNHKTRVVFEYGEGGIIAFLKIGDHDIYR